MGGKAKTLGKQLIKPIPSAIAATTILLVGWVHRDEMGGYFRSFRTATASLGSLIVPSNGNLASRLIFSLHDGRHRKPGKQRSTPQ